MKLFADDKINVSEKLKFVLERVENIVGKGENAGYQHFILFLQCFLVGKGENAGYQHFLLFLQYFEKATFSKVIKTRDCVVKSKAPFHRTFRSDQYLPSNGTKACLILTENFEPQFSSVTLAFCFKPISCCNLELPLVLLLAPVTAPAFGLSPIISKTEVNEKENIKSRNTIYFYGLLV